MYSDLVLRLLYPERGTAAHPKPKGLTVKLLPCTADFASPTSPYAPGAVCARKKGTSSHAA